jgi:chloramphenicol O-acetyltransferase type A
VSGRALDLETWPRRSAFEHFRRYADPRFGISAELEVGPTRRLCRARGHSFHLAAWYLCLRSLEGVEAMRYRLRGDTVWVHDRLGLAITAPGPDDTFRFCHVPPAEDFAGFVAAHRAAVAAPPPERLDDRPEADDRIYGTTVPWVRFTGLSHARRGDPDDAVPRVAFGRVTELGERTVMPVQIDVHHAVVDGLHVGRFFEAFESALADPEPRLA